MFSKSGMKNSLTRSNFQQYRYYIGSIIYLFIAFFLVFNHDQFLQDDAYTYWLRANRNPTGFYPAGIDLYYSNLMHPFIINLMRLLMYFGMGVGTMQCLNVVMTLTLIHLFRKLVATVFDEKIAWITFCLSLLYPNFYIWNLGLNTEIFFLIFLVTSLRVFYSQNKYKYWILGALMPILDYTRPFAMLFIAAWMMVECWRCFSKQLLFKQLLVRVAQFAAGYVLLFLVIGGIYQWKNQQFFTKSKVIGYNLIIAANDHHYITWTVEPFLKGNVAYIENEDSLTYDVKDKIWLARGLHWIPSHIVPYSISYFKRLAYMYTNDLNYFMFSYRHYHWGSMVMDYRSGKGIFDLILKYPWLWFTIVVFWVITFLEIRGLVQNGVKESQRILLIVALFLILIPPFFTVQTRYHIPTLLLLLPWASMFIQRKLDKINP